MKTPHLERNFTPLYLLPILASLYYLPTYDPKEPTLTTSAKPSSCLLDILRPTCEVISFSGVQVDFDEIPGSRKGGRVRIVKVGKITMREKIRTGHSIKSCLRRSTKEENLRKMLMMFPWKEKVKRRRGI